MIAICTLIYNVLYLIYKCRWYSPDCFFNESVRFLSVLNIQYDYIQVGYLPFLFLEFEPNHYRPQPHALSAKLFEIIIFIWKTICWKH